MVQVEVVLRLLILFEATGSRSHIMGVPIQGLPPAQFVVVPGGVLVQRRVEMTLEVT